MNRRLSTRLREILSGPSGPPRPGHQVEAASSPLAVGAPLASAAAAALGGDVIETSSGPCVRVVRVYAADHRHGALRVGDCSEDVQERAENFPVLSGTSIGNPSLNTPAGTLLFVDLETTGLSGGAGTYAFLVGCAAFDGDAFRVEQFFMIGHSLERALLEAVRASIEASGALVTYNGKTFDVPVLETRFLFHRQTPPFSDRLHLDMLPAARRLWRGARPMVDGPGAPSDSCALTVLEQSLFGLRRYRDVAGFEIPARFFGFLRSADARPLEPVFEHNRLDLLSLALLTARGLRLMGGTPTEVIDAREAYGIGCLLERAGATDRAEEWYTRAVALAERSWHGEDELVRVQALRALALRCRRSQRYGEAELCWSRITAARRCPPGLLREALEALAIHHEHRSRDLERARTFAEQSGSLSRAAGHNGAVQRRLARLHRKLDRYGETLLDVTERGM